MPATLMIGSEDDDDDVVAGGDGVQLGVGQLSEVDRRGLRYAQHVYAGPAGPRVDAVALVRPAGEPAGPLPPGARPARPAAGPPLPRRAGRPAGPLLAT